MSELVLEVRNLCKHYPVAQGKLEVLRNVNMTLHKGEFLAIMGMSGVGKSTLLNVIGLLDSYSSGDLIFHADGQQQHATDLSGTQQARMRNELIGFVFQFFHLLPDLDVRENVLLPAMIERTRRQYRRERSALEKRAQSLLEIVGVADRSDHAPQALSGGERQRVAIARALMNEPSLLLCDEPTGNLDTETSSRVHSLFQSLNQELGTSILLVTHDPSLAAQAHRTVSMIDGRFVDADEPASVE